MPRFNLRSWALVAVTASLAAAVAAGESHSVPGVERRRDRGEGPADAAGPRHEYRHDEQGSEESRSRQSSAFRRRLAQSAAEAFASWTPERARRATPLDLKIDQDGGKAYVAGMGGYLEPYEESFTRIGQGEDVGGEYWDSILELDAIVEDADSHLHLQAGHRPENRLYYKILEADRIGTEAKQWLRGRKDNRRLDEEAVIEIDLIEFSVTRQFDSQDHPPHDEHNSEEEEDEDEEEESRAILDQGRSLQGDFAPDSGPFIASNSLPGGETQEVRQDYPSGLRPRRRDGNKNKAVNKNKNKNKTKHKRQQEQGGRNRKVLPSVDRLTPSRGYVVQGKQTFSAVISPSIHTNSPIDKVLFQLTDHTGSSSDWIDIKRSYGDLYEITINGFEKYPDTRWRYVMRAEDRKGNKSSSGNVFFRVKRPAGSSGNEFPKGSNGSSSTPLPTPERAPPTPSQPLPENFTADSNWPHGGSIQKSTGRIMFEFDDADQSFVCSGTVICDGPRGQTGDMHNGRSIVQTAAHCAYNDVLKKFSKRAIFVPDQDSTRGDRSDFNCGNDEYGCWHLSFAVAAKGWTEESFPQNVPYDYAYYVVHDDLSTHSGGYAPFLTGILDRDIPCVPVDFDSDLGSDFIFSIGYSADKDPLLRHCAMANTHINGIPWYTNFWLDDCAMTGGASGGPWMRDLDMHGRGTLISVNSWGFTHRAGMAGPSLRTKSGSWAECLYDMAKRADDPGWEGGIIANDC